VLQLAILIGNLPIEVPVVDANQRNLLPVRKRRDDIHRFANQVHVGRDRKQVGVLFDFVGGPHNVIGVAGRDLEVPVDHDSQSSTYGLR
jgi:hypothetical protein